MNATVSAPALITDTEALLRVRSDRPPDHARENAALHRLVEEICERPDEVLELLCRLALEVCDAGSSGVSVLDDTRGEAVLAWRAVAGSWSAVHPSRLPRDPAPCLSVARAGAVLMFQNIAGDGDAPKVHEAFVAPFPQTGLPGGALWVIAHDETRKFDGEDRRMLRQIARMAASVHDALSKTEAAREATERLSQAVSRTKAVGLWEWDADKDIVRVDAGPAFSPGDDGGGAAVAVPTAAFIEALHPDDRSRTTLKMQSSLASGAPFGAEYRVVDEDGQIRHLLAQADVGVGGEPRHFYGVTVDITQQRRAENALLRTQDRYSALFHSIDAGFCVIEVDFRADGRARDYRFLEVNPAFEAQSGIIDAVGRTMREIAPDHEQSWFDLYGDVARTGEPARIEGRAAALGDRCYDVYAYRIGQPDERLVAVLFTDVTARRRMEEALRTSELRFRTLAQAMPNHVWTARPDGHLDWFNDRIYEYGGVRVGSLDGAAWVRMVHPDDTDATVQAWARAVSTAAPYETEFRLRRRDGVYRWHLVRAAPMRDAEGAIACWIGANADIEDQKAAAAALADMNAALESRVEQRSQDLMAAEEALRQAQKMEAVGQLTGGIAHDFNNMLTGITGSLDLIRRRLAEGRSDDVQKYMDAAVGSAQRAAALTHRLLAFARRQSLDTRPHDIARLILGMEDMLVRTLGEDVRLKKEIAPDLWLGLTDANQFENALLNLVINARDAMPEGGTLTISARNAYLDEAYVRGRDDVVAGDYVAVGVVDTGVGMSEDVVSKAFDPFFTTKPVGQGTGLGLSMIYGFAKQSGGHIRIHSRLGQGTTAKLYLRRSLRAEEFEEPVVHPLTPMGRGESILVVEDDPTVRLIITEVLNELGYLHHVAEDAPTALKIVTSGAVIDLLISDVGLPVMNGRQLAEIARQHRPELKVLFVTGYAQNAALRSDFLAPGMEMMTKPFTMDQLAARIRKLIDPRRP